MKSITKLIAILIASTVLLACDSGGSSKPVKMVKVFKLVKEVSTRTNGDVSSIITNTYDKNGFLIKKEIDEDANGKIDHFSDSYIAYDYSNGVLSKKIFYRASGSKSAERLVDKQGRETEVTLYDKNGSIRLTGLFVNTYDNKKRIIKEELSTNNDPVKRVIVFSYEGNIETRKYDTDMDGQTDDVTYILTHNDRGELIKKERYDVNQTLIGTENYTYEYDDNDNIITRTLSYPTNPTGGEVTTYTWEERSVPEIYAK